MPLCSHSQANRQSLREGSSIATRACRRCQNRRKQPQHCPCPSSPWFSLAITMSPFLSSRPPASKARMKSSFYSISLEYSGLACSLYPLSILHLDLSPPKELHGLNYSIYLPSKGGSLSPSKPLGLREATLNPSLMPYPKHSRSPPNSCCTSLDPRISPCSPPFFLGPGPFSHMVSPHSGL